MIAEVLMISILTFICIIDKSVLILDNTQVQVFKCLCDNNNIKILFPCLLVLIFAKWFFKNLTYVFVCT